MFVCGHNIEITLRRFTNTVLKPVFIGNVCLNYPLPSPDPLPETSTVGLSVFYWLLLGYYLVTTGS